MMKMDWTGDDIENKARAALGGELAAAADLFPRVVTATFIQLTADSAGADFLVNTDDFRRKVRENIPASLTEVVPFFVRNVWNRGWTFPADEERITELAERYVALLAQNRSEISLQELIQECRKSFSGVPA